MIIFFLKRTLPVAIVLLTVLFVAACGGSSSSSGGSTPTATTSSSTPTTAATATSAGSTPTATTSGSAALIHTTQATINGKSETILTNAQGMTLYYRTSDTATVVCSGGCAQIWPPLTISSGSPTSSSPLPGKLTVSMNTNGKQVEYNGHPLYTFTGDTAAGQTNGEGTGGVWFVVPTSLQ